MADENIKFHKLLKEYLDNREILKEYSFCDAFYDNLCAAESQISQKVSAFSGFIEMWKERPRRGEVPEFRIIMNSKVDSKGTLVVEWSPLLYSYDESKSAASLAKWHFGNINNALKVEGFQQVSEFVVERLKNNKATDKTDEAIEGNVARNLLWACSILQDIYAEAYSKVVKCRLSQALEVGYKGAYTIKDLDEDCYKRLKKWTDDKIYSNEDMGRFYVWCYQKELNAQKIRDVARSKGYPEVKYADASYALTMLKEIEVYNNAWWRRTSAIILPEAGEPSRVIPQNKSLTIRSGSKPRLSPVAIRGIEGTQLVPKEQLRKKIEDKIAKSGFNWHFTAGDFIEFVDLDKRSHVVSILDAMRKSKKIVAIYKGLYVVNPVHFDPEQAVAALSRDRGEEYVPSYEDALLKIGLIDKDPSVHKLTYFNDQHYSRTLKMMGHEVSFCHEPIAGLVLAAYSDDNPEWFVASVAALAENLYRIEDVEKLVTTSSQTESCQAAKRFMSKFI